MQSLLHRATLGLCDDLDARAKTSRPSRFVVKGLSSKQDTVRTSVEVSRRKAGIGMLIGTASTMLVGDRHQSANAETLAVPNSNEISEELRALYELRLQREAEAYQRLEELRVKGETQARSEESRSPLKDSLCATPFGIDVVGITQTIALIGALVGGLSARNRKIELEELNDKLRNVNKVLREQARSGITYAPGLTYAPAGVTSGVDPAAPVAPPAETEMNEARAALKEGKRLLRLDTPTPGPAMVQFKKALMLTRMQNDRNLERRAMRGLAAAKRLQGDLRGSVADFKAVLQISQEIQEYTGDTDALGTIADLLTELGDIEEAGKYYDMYLYQLQDDNEATL